MNIIDIPYTVSLTISALMAVLAGRSFAKKIHDVGMYGKGVIGLPTYFTLLLSYVFSIATFTLTKVLELPVRLVMNGFDMLSVIEGLAFSTLITLVSYVVFLRRYRRITGPLTLEGRIAHSVQRKVLRVKELPNDVHTMLSKEAREAINDIVRKARKAVEDVGGGD